MPDFGAASTGAQATDENTAPTPFGIIDENTTAQAGACELTGECSTPFGIIDENTPDDDQLPDVER